MSEQNPRFDPQTGKPLYPPDNGMKPGVVALIAVIAAAIGLGVGALLFNGNNSTTKTTDSVITAPGRTEVTVQTTPGKTVTQTQTVTVNTTDTTGGSSTP
jgi:hypothetical protein